jgi:TP901 family phage tail tape measure protein
MAKRKAGVVEIEARFGVGKLKSDIKQAQDRLKGFGKTAGVIGGGIATLGASFSFVANKAVQASLDMDESLGRIGTLIPGQVDRLAELKEGIADVAVEFGRSSSMVSDGAFSMISALGDGPETIGRLKAAMEAAIGGGASLNSTVELLTKTSVAYGDASEETMRKVSDLAFATNRLGVTTFPELASSMPQVTKLSAQLGVSMEELFAVMAVGTKTSKSTSTTATELQGVMTALLQQTGDIGDVFESMGVKSAEAAIAQHGLVGTLEAIARHAKDSGGNLSDYFKNVEGLKSVLPLVGASNKLFADTFIEMKNATGETGAAFGEMTKGANSLRQVMAQTSKALADTFRILGDVVREVFGVGPAEMIRDLAFWVRDMAKAFKGADPLVKKVVIGVGAFAAGITVLAVPLAGAAALIGVKLVAAFTLFGTAIGGASALMLTFREDFVRGMDILLNDWPKAQAQFERGWDRLWTSIKNLTGRIVSLVEDMEEKIRAALVDKFQRTVDSVKGKVESVTGFFADMYDQVVGNSFVPDMIDEIGTHFSRLDGEMVRPATQAVDATNKTFSELGTDIKSVLVDGIEEGLRTGFNKDLLSGVVSDLGGLVSSSVGGAISSAIGGSLGAFGGPVGSIVGGSISSVFDGLLNVANGGKFGLQNSANLALVTGGASFLVDPLVSALGSVFGGGKDQDQIIRDQMRQALVEAGVITQDHLLPLFGGGSASLSPGGDNFRINSPEAQKLIPFTDALSTVFSGEANEQLSAMFANAIAEAGSFTEQLLTVDMTLANMGHTVESAKDSLTESFLAGEISLDQFGVAVKSLNELATGEFASIGDAVDVLANNLGPDGNPQAALKALEFAFKKASEGGENELSTLGAYIGQRFGPEAESIFGDLASFGVTSFESFSNLTADQIHGLFRIFEQFGVSITDSLALASDSAAGAVGSGINKILSDVEGAIDALDKLGGKQSELSDSSQAVSQPSPDTGQARSTGVNLSIEVNAPNSEVGSEERIRRVVSESVPVIVRSTERAVAEKLRRGTL